MQGSVVVTRMKRTFGVGGNPSKGQVLDVYNDVELPHPDAKVTENLSIGGACFYVLPNKDANVNSGVIDATIGNNMEMLSMFVLTEVVPNIQSCVPESCALVLGKAFLWFIYRDDAVFKNFLPKETKS
jgi:hypothetical protein